MNIDKLSSGWLGSIIITVRLASQPTLANFDLKWLKTPKKINFKKIYEATFLPLFYFVFYDYDNCGFYIVVL